MCGITGIVALTEQGTERLSRLEIALPTLSRRGPDDSGIFHDRRIALGHARLSIIDTSHAGHQPMSDPTGRYTIVFNGEFFNFKSHRELLLQQGVALNSASDTEVLLNWYMLEGPECLHRINGFFSLAIYDRREKSLFIARDRFGVKPLLVYQDQDQLIFASEMKTLLAMGIPKKLDRASLETYLHLNYIPGPNSILEGVTKLEPGHYLFIQDIENTPVIEKKRYYTLEDRSEVERVTNYQSACKQLETLMEAAVERRMVADVPLGAFLSGGIDSSIVTGLAARSTKGLKTFSIGFRDEPMFDETQYAEAVARMHHTDHTVFRLSNDDLFSILFDVLDYLDEPFGDSSALNVFLLSRETRKQVTVALSGDGADEVFGGYNKHEAEWRMRNNNVSSKLVRLGAPIWKVLPKSRNSKLSNVVRKLDRFAKGAALSPADRYWRWAGYTDEQEITTILLGGSDLSAFASRKKSATKYIVGGESMNDVLLNDVSLVLTNDMLQKVDLMSMANSLEVRSP
ncbi:MAG: asparagine synthase (glutamine-hydrolyzing), partial [Bacteroidota bacterium]